MPILALDLVNLLLYANPGGSVCYSLRFADEETEAQRSKIRCLGHPATERPAQDSTQAAPSLCSNL